MAAKHDHQQKTVWVLLTLKIFVLQKTSRKLNKIQIMIGKYLKVMYLIPDLYSEYIKNLYNSIKIRQPIKQ